MYVCMYVTGKCMCENIQYTKVFFWINQHYCNIILIQSHAGLHWIIDFCLSLDSMIFNDAYHSIKSIIWLWMQNWQCVRYFGAPKSSRYFFHCICHCSWSRMKNSISMCTSTNKLAGVWLGAEQCIPLLLFSLAIQNVFQSLSNSEALKRIIQIKSLNFDLDIN